MTTQNPCDREHNCHSHAPGKHSHAGKSSEQHMNKAAILDALAVQPGQVVLDAGCGNGYMSKEFSALVGPTGKVFALDPDEETISNLHQQTEGTNIRTIVGDATKNVPIEDTSLDLIYLSTVFHGFTPDEITGFGQEVTRLLRPGGRLAVIEIDKTETPMGPPMDIRFSPEELCKKIPLTPTALRRAGAHFYLQIFER